MREIKITLEKRKHRDFFVILAKKYADEKEKQGELTDIKKKRIMNDFIIEILNSSLESERKKKDSKENINKTFEVRSEVESFKNFEGDKADLGWFSVLLFLLKPDEKEELQAYLFDYRREMEEKGYLQWKINLITFGNILLVVVPKLFSTILGLARFWEKFNIG